MLSAVIGYLMGSLNTSIIISKWKGDDIRAHGSGNAGATNTLRVLGKKAAAIALGGDILKTVIAVLICFFVFGSIEAKAAAGAGAVLGHNFPLYFGFRGGKGIATSFIAVLMLDFRTALCALCVFIIVLALSRYVSLSSICAAVSVALFAAFFNGVGTIFWVCLAIGVLAIIRHRSNIKRLIGKTENKLGGGNKT